MLTWSSAGSSFVTLRFSQVLLKRPNWIQEALRMWLKLELLRFDVWYYERRLIVLTGVPTVLCCAVLNTHSLHDNCCIPKVTVCSVTLPCHSSVQCIIITVQLFLIMKTHLLRFRNFVSHWFQEQLLTMQNAKSYHLHRSTYFIASRFKLSSSRNCSWAGAFLSQTFSNFCQNMPNDKA